jgi:thymidine kinase
MCELIVGCMFAGKSGELQRRIAGAAGRVVQLTHARDTRTTTHDGAPVTAQHVRWLADLPPIDADIVTIDEAQFFDPHDIATFVCTTAVPRVIIAGLDTDLHRRPWPAIEMLRAVATSVTVMFARCRDCDEPAAWSRFDGTPAALAGNVCVGGADMWAPVCDAHWHAPQAA